MSSPDEMKATPEMIDFLSDFADLLKQHNVECEIETEMRGSSYYRDTVVTGLAFEQREPYCSVTIEGKYIAHTDVKSVIDEHTQE